MKYALTLAALLLANGCGKKSAVAPEAPAPAQAAKAVAPTSSDGSSAAPAEIDYSKTLDRLTQAVRKYAAEMRTAPKSLDEVAAAGYLPETPTAPPGKKYVIDEQLRVRLK